MVHPLPKQPIMLSINTQKKSEKTHPFLQGACVTAQGTGSLGGTSADGKHYHSKQGEQAEGGRSIISKGWPREHRKGITGKHKLAHTSYRVRAVCHDRGHPAWAVVPAVCVSLCVCACVCVRAILLLFLSVSCWHGVCAKLVTTG